MSRPMISMNTVLKHEIKVAHECHVAMLMFDVSHRFVRDKTQATISKHSICIVFVLAPPRFRLPAKYHDTLNYDKGETIVIKIPYTGSPMPNVSLSKDGQDVSNDRNVSIDVTDRGITLTIRNADKNTSGPYKIKLDNNLGSDEATLRINVSGQFILSVVKKNGIVHSNH
jgi:outer membrane lipoprotein-sorting protein